MCRVNIIILLLLIGASLLSSAQGRQPAFEMNERLGRGINMGNSFEAPTETEWGNPWQPSYFRIISELGFHHVRVPVRWETAERSMASAPYTIDPDFLDRIQEVVDAALENKLHIIINMHHHDALFENPEAQKERFLSQWSQIAEHFHNYPDSLLFEVLNEPHGNLTPPMWNEYFADALTEIRETNPTRVVLMGIADFGGLGGISKLELPDDDYIIMSPHYYNPFQFTHQGAEWVTGADPWLGTEWLDTEAERETVESEFNYALHFSETHHIPIHVGEFGAYSKADLESRVRWTTFLARWFEEHNMSWAYWEFSAGFGIYNPATQQQLTALVDALQHNEMPEPTPVFATPVYTSNFSGGTDGWTLTQQAGAAGTLTASGNKLNISIANGGSEAWHLQLVKNGVTLEQNKLYRLTFTGSAEADRSITFYAGRASSPWNAYSGVNGVSIFAEETTYSFTFEMTSATDPSARLVFDLGTNASDVSITNVRVEELSLSVVIGTEDAKHANVIIYPNPSSSYIRIENTEGYNKVDLMDMNGRTHAKFRIVRGTNVLRVNQIPSGMYILRLSGHGKSARVKIFRE